MLRFEQDEVVTFKGDLNNLLSGQKKLTFFRVEITSLYFQFLSNLGSHKRWIRAQSQSIEVSHRTG